MRLRDDVTQSRLQMVGISFGSCKWLEYPSEALVSELTREGGSAETRRHIDSVSVQHLLDQVGFRANLRFSRFYHCDFHHSVMQQGPGLIWKYDCLCQTWWSSF